MHYGEVCLFDIRVRGERLRKTLHRLLRLRDDDEPRCVLVEPVDDSRPRHAADSGERRAVVQQSIHERAGEMARRRMHDHSGGLVHDDHVVVFEHDVERNVLRLGNRRHRGRNLHLYVVGLRDLHPRLGGDGAVYRDVPGLDEPLYPRPRKVGVKFEDPLVKPLHRK